MKETDIVRLCMMEASRLGCVVWRNNTGALKDARGRLVRYGLCTGSADIIGLAPDGRFLAIECKTEKGHLNDSQRTFLEIVRKNGGIAFVATCADDLKKHLTDA